MKPFLFILAAFFIISCAVPVRTDIASEGLTPLPPDVEVITINEYESEPANSRFIGMVEAGSMWVGNNCSRDILMDKAQAAARAEGANIIKLISVARCYQSTPCPTMKFGMFRNDDETAIADYKKQHQEINASTLPADADYALIHFYRSRDRSRKSRRLPIIGWEGKITSLRDNQKFTYRSKDFGPRRFQVGKFSPILTIDVQPGQEYYASFDLRLHDGQTLPDLYLVDNVVGRAEVKTVSPFDREAGEDTD